MFDSEAPTRVVRLERIELTNVRTYARLDLTLESGLTVLVGANGVGKTNLLEAVAVALTGASPRTSAELRLVREGSAAARIAAQVRIGEDVHAREVVFEPGRGKALRVDANAARGVDAYSAQTPALTFLPERLLIIRGAPARRRALVDHLTARVVGGAAANLRAYEHALRQRNSLLRRGKSSRVDEGQLAPWTEQLIERGAHVRADRDALLLRLAAPFAARFTQLTDLTDARFVVHPRGGRDIAAALEEAAPLERRRGTTSAGPHLDELAPEVADRDLRAFGSTGEQRAALLAFTLAARDVLGEALGVAPVLLLDEPWSELDQDRRERLTSSLLGEGQVLVTSTEPPAHLVELRAAGADIDVRHVSLGVVKPWIPATPPSLPISPTPPS